MKQGSVTVNEVVEALKMLGGTGKSRKIENYIIETRGGILPKTYEVGGWDSYRKTINQVIQFHCRFYSKYHGPEYFEYLGPGNYALINFQKANNLHLIETRKIESHSFAKETKIDENQLEDLLKEKKDIGQMGEEKVIEYEKRYLTDNGRNDLANHVQQISKKSISEGYDILSFDLDGNKKFIEVKTTKNSSDCFYLSDNELNVARQLNHQYWIYKVTLNENNDISIKQFCNPSNFIDQGIWEISPLNYLVKLKNT